MENYKIKVQDTTTGESAYIKTSDGDYITQRNSGLKILTDLDLKESYVDNVTLVPVSVPPSNPKEGQIYYNEKKKKSYQYNGTEWKEIGGSDVGKITAEGGEIFNDYTDNVAAGSYSHAEGVNNAAKAVGAHAEGNGNVIEGAAMAGHAEGWGNAIYSEASHAEGSSNVVQGDYGHAEGEGCMVGAYCGHAEGESTMSIGESSHAEGIATTSWGNYSHAEGDASEAGGGNGYKVTGQGEDNYHLVLSTVEGIAVGEIMLYALGSSGNITSKKINITAIDTENKIITVDTEVALSSNFSYVIFMTNLHNQGGEILPTSAQHSEGDSALAIGHVTHAEGCNTRAFGTYSHAEGNTTITYGNMSHAEGYYAKAKGHISHAEGMRSVSSGTASHAEGQQTSAMGQASHAEGVFTVASGKGQHVQGMYNIEDTEEKYLHIVGNGEGVSARSNAHTIDCNGNGWFKGNLKIGGTGYEDETAKTVATTDYVPAKAKTADKLTNKVMIKMSGAIRGQSVQFDGSSEITLEATRLQDKYLSWNTVATPSVNNLSPLDQALVGQSSNCFGFLPSECMKVEYSTDNGEHWINYPFTEEDKTKFLTPETRSTWTDGSSRIYLGGPLDVPVTTNSLTRITIEAWSGENRVLYTNIKKLIMRISTNGAKNCKIKLQKECCNNLGTYVDMGECLVEGWPRWLTLNSNFIFGANSLTNGGEQAKSIRLIMSCGALSESSNNKFVLTALQAISDNVYWYDPNVTFSCYIQNHVPYQLNTDHSVKFIGDIQLKNSNKLIGVSQKAEQDINGKTIVDTYATKIEVNSQINAMPNLKACYHINIGNITSVWKTAITLDNFNKDNTIVYALNESGTNADGSCTIQKILSVGNSVDMGLFTADGSTTVLMQLTNQGLIQLKIGEKGVASGSENSKIHVMVYTGVSNTTITSLP